MNLPSSEIVTTFNLFLVRLFPVLPSRCLISGLNQCTYARHASRIAPLLATSQNYLGEISLRHAYSLRSVSGHNVALQRHLFHRNTRGYLSPIKCVPTHPSFRLLFSECLLVQARTDHASADCAPWTDAIADCAAEHGRIFLISHIIYRRPFVESKLSHFFGRAYTNSDPCFESTRYCHRTPAPARTRGGV